jgi:hypothetical protein
MWRLSWNSVNSTSWSPKGLFRQKKNSFTSIFYLYYTSKIFLVFASNRLGLAFSNTISLVLLFPTVELLQSLSITCLWWSKYPRLSMFIVRTAKTFILKSSMWLCLVVQSFFLPMTGLHLFEQCRGCCSHQSELSCSRISLIDIFLVALLEHQNSLLIFQHSERAHFKYLLTYLLIINNKCTILQLKLHK